MDLNALGWNPSFEAFFAELSEQDLIAGRVMRVDRQRYRVQGADGVWSAVISGRFGHQARQRSDFPAIGDWVALQVDADQAVIHHLLPRKSRFSRQAVGTDGRGGGSGEEQVIAANIDTVFLVNGLDGGRNFQLQRLERYLTLAWDSGADPVVVLNKADLCDTLEVFIAQAESVAFGVPVHVVSAIEDNGVEALVQYLGVGRTGAFLGPSGVGKSTLINTLLNTELDTGQVRHGDLRGKHTTTWSEVLCLPEGGLLIDTPGIRDIQLWADEQGLRESFEDVEALIAACRFVDCGHQSEPGCAVQQAVLDGTLDLKRLESYRKLKKEIQFLEDKRIHLSAKEDGNKKLSKSSRKWKKDHPKI